MAIKSILPGSISISFVAEKFPIEFPIDAEVSYVVIIDDDLAFRKICSCRCKVTERMTFAESVDQIMQTIGARETIEMPEKASIEVAAIIETFSGL